MMVWLLSTVSILNSLTLLAVTSSAALIPSMYLRTQRSTSVGTDLAALQHLPIRTMPYDGEVTMYGILL